jgi:hypothetical protein
MENFGYYVASYYEVRRIIPSILILPQPGFEITGLANDGKYRSTHYGNQDCTCNIAGHGRCFDIRKYFHRENR